MNTLPSKIHDSQNGLDYTLVGDYYLPDLENESCQPIGKYGRARMKYLKEHRLGLYSRLLLSGNDLHEADPEAQSLPDQIIPRMAAEASVNEELKAIDPMRWGMMNTIKAQVEEIMNWSTPCPMGHIQTVNSLKYPSRALKEKGINFKYHHLRHTCGTHLADMNIPPHLLRNQMGHGKIETTRKYYIAVSEDGIAELKRGIELL